MSEVSYKDAGVDLELYDQAMRRLPALMAKTHTGRVMDLPGGFAGLFRLQGEGRTYRDPVLVSGTDGVGTKLKVALLAKKFDTVGIDLVAMCVNDCLCLGAEPLFFLDYLALGHDNPDLVATLVAGVSAGCIEAGAALLGGETAIMPDLYAEEDFDMAGFCVGVVERDQVIDGSKVAPGDLVIGLASSGFHSNGFSLIRKALFDRLGMRIDQHITELGAPLAEVLLKPTRIYAKPINTLLQMRSLQGRIHGMAHITGGGLVENTERVLPENCRLALRDNSWPMPAVYQWFQSLGQVSADEMARVFNMGVGYVVIADASAAEETMQTLTANGETAWRIGEIHAK
jgi:phosphoribosylformylglycinamidine cyclo-ligase